MGLRTGCSSADGAVDSMTLEYLVVVEVVFVAAEWAAEIL